MADKLSVIVDEIRTTIKQTFDDKVVSRAQVAYWTIIVANQLLGQHNAKRSSGAFLSVYVVPVITSDKNILPNIIKGRKYIELPSAIFDYDQDGGVEYMAYYNPDENCKPEYRIKTIQRTSPSTPQWLELVKPTRPSPDNPYFWRAGDIFPIIGIESVPVKEVEIGIYQTIDPLEKIDINKPFPFPQELMNQLKRQVTDLARFSFLFPADRENTGSDETSSQQGKAIPKIVSVNEQQ